MQPTASIVEWATLIAVAAVLISLLALFIKLLDKSRDHGRRIGIQEEKNNNMEKDIETNTGSIESVNKKIDNLTEKHIIPMQKEISRIGASIIRK